MAARQLGLIPPDVADLPPLPAPFVWRLPHIKQHRRPKPEGRQIATEDGLPAVASVQPGTDTASVTLGVHRFHEHRRHYRRFDGPGARETGLRYAARWVDLHAPALLEELEDVRRRNTGQS